MAGASFPREVFGKINNTENCGIICYTINET
jgi:hypothetical protein